MLTMLTLARANMCRAHRHLSHILRIAHHNGKRIVERRIIVAQRRNDVTAARCYRRK